MMGALRPPPHEQHGVVIVRTGKYQPKVKRKCQSIGLGVSNAVQRCNGKVKLRR